MMPTYYVDGHVHIGRTSSGQAVKISAANNLTVEGILQEAMVRKGLDIIGIIDAVSPPVQSDIRELLEQGDLEALSAGGLGYKEKVTLLLGAEVEVAGPHGGAAHFGVFVPTLSALQELSTWLAFRQTNPTLSSQRITTGTAEQLATLCQDLAGIFIINHAFTPHKGLYGNCVNVMSDMVSTNLVTGVELGLSADTDMADRLSELADFTFVTNSDAHSLPKLAREYHVVSLTEPTFDAYKQALLRRQDQRIVMNIGLMPALGKYHRTACRKCGNRLEEPSQPCPTCGSMARVRGVWERLLEVADLQESKSPLHRPPYIHQVPLEFIPGLGQKKREQLFHAFGTEMNILHHTSLSDLRNVVGDTLAQMIDQARTGQLMVTPGAGGRYGKITDGQPTEKK